MNQRERNELDRHITGNYGEDSVEQPSHEDFATVVEALERAFITLGRFGGNHVLHPQDPQGTTIRHEEIRAAWVDARKALADVGAL